MEHAQKVFDEMSLPNVLEKACSLDQNKPDFKELDLGIGGMRSINKEQDQFRRRSNRSHSGELNATSIPNITTPEKVRSGFGDVNRKLGHRRSYSTGAPLIYSGSGTGTMGYFNGSSNNTASTSSTTTTTNSGGSGSGGSGGNSSVNSPNTSLYPAGNICPSGKILKSNMNTRSSTTRPEKLGLGMGTGNYGHGSIIKGGGRSVESNGEIGMIIKKAMISHDVEEVKNAGNELYKRGNFTEALSLYDRAITISPENAACRSNRAAALTMLGRLGEAVKECEEAVRLNPGFQRAHQRLASLYLRLGQVDRAYHHLSHGQHNDLTELQKLQTLEKHINRCSDARKIGDWKGVLRECEAAMLTGAVSSPQIIACKAEAFLKLHQLEDVDSILVELPKVEPFPATCTKVKFFGMYCEAYVFYVRARVDMAFGRFETAAAFAEKASLIDYGNMEVGTLLKHVNLINRARVQGKDLFNSGRFSEACAAYGEGLKYNLSNSVLYCNRAVCWSKLGLWEKSVEDCNLALNVHPNYTKALMRRAVSNAKVLERWGEAVRDYEILSKELPGDNEVAESLSRAQEALRLARGEPSGVNRVRASTYSSELPPSSIRSRNH
ncbi:putative tetratricopeptide-like helical domain superfamily, acetyltransferase A, auxiliary subunit [Helianthus annuus]|uniref:Tetratricopeptide-like helical domain superfamily, acetyltransferase A, auxiliary subunit n=1 Tax=Helianthus annuus TaxID=4232 RepID=A0A9K3GV02_HELAN|nr:putative tetratricopeptide-like helical domain superfamily, acetyltransferase A, auxiliary subunit [Helianthus annuus]KAJ0429955.1 putative tetratricopeptide-like helical domain superfamily, TPR repeat-containing thioredoxin TTL1-4 [Helianthus annuus]